MPNREMTTDEGLLSPVFVIGTISVGQMEGASCLNVGNNFPTNFQSYKKHNQGFGSVNGDHNVVPNLRALLNDPDVLDTVSFSPQPDVPEWVQRLIEDTRPSDALAQSFLDADAEANHEPWPTQNGEQTKWER